MADAPTRALEDEEIAALCAEIRKRGARAVAVDIGIASDALTNAAAGGNARAGTNAALRLWLTRGARS